MNNITLGLTILTTTLLISGCTSDGDSASSKDENSLIYDGVSAQNYTKKVSGRVVDGYIKDARLKISSIGSNIQLPIFVNGKGAYSLTSSSDGGFEFYLSGDEGNVSLSATNGEDTATGEIFEGNLETVIVQEDSIDSKRARALSFQSDKEVLSPLTTLVAKQILSGKTEAQAKSSIATQLGIDVELIKRDVIEIMQNGTATERGDAAKAWKQGVVVQKIVESYSKSIGGASDGEAFELVSKAIYESIATLMEEGNSLENLVNESSLVSNQAISDIKANDDITEIIGTEATALISEKILATQEVVATSIKSVYELDITKIAEATDSTTITGLLENSAKSVEMATKQVEDSLEKIASATDTQAINVAKDEAVKTANAIDELGGLEKLEDIIIEAKESLNEDETLDISDFADLIITDDLVENTKLFDDVIIADIAKDSVKGEVIVPDDLTPIVNGSTASTSTIDSSSGFTPTTTTPRDYDKLLINSISIANTPISQNSDGTFETIAYQSTDLNESSDIADLYRISFDIDNPSTDGMEAGDTKTVTLGLKIATDYDDTKFLFIAIKNIQLSLDSTGIFGVTVPNTSTVEIYIQDSSGGVLVSLTNAEANGAVTTDASGALVDFNFSPAMAKFENKLDNYEGEPTYYGEETNTTLSESNAYSGDLDRSYNVDFIISGLDGVCITSANKYSKVPVPLQSIFDSSRTYGFTGLVHLNFGEPYNDYPN